MGIYVGPFKKEEINEIATLKQFISLACSRVPDFESKFIGGRKLTNYCKENSITDLGQLALKWKESPLLQQILIHDQELTIKVLIERGIIEQYEMKQQQNELNQFINLNKDRVSLRRLQDFVTEMDIRSISEFAYKYKSGVFSALTQEQYRIIQLIIFKQHQIQHISISYQIPSQREKYDYPTNILVVAFQSSGKNQFINTFANYLLKTELLQPQRFKCQFVIKDNLKCIKVSQKIDYRMQGFNSISSFNFILVPSLKGNSEDLQIIATLDQFLLKKSISFIILVSQQQEQYKLGEMNICKQISLTLFFQIFQNKLPQSQFVHVIPNSNFTKIEQENYQGNTSFFHRFIEDCNENPILLQTQVFTESDITERTIIKHQRGKVEFFKLLNKITEKGFDIQFNINTIEQIQRVQILQQMKQEHCQLNQNIEMMAILQINIVTLQQITQESIITYQYQMQVIQNQEQIIQQINSFHKLQQENSQQVQQISVNFQQLRKDYDSNLSDQEIVQILLNNEIARKVQLIEQMRGQVKNILNYLENLFQTQKIGLPIFEQYYNHIGLSELIR